jgi:hypothetical protein
VQSKRQKTYYQGIAAMTHIVVNVFGGPNSGKTTLAAELFTRLKKRHIDVELVPEFAKDLILEGNLDALEHQWYVTGNQAYRVANAYKKVEVVLVDSPILLGPIYDSDASLALLQLSLEHHHKFNNINLFVPRNPNYPHTMNGRVHSVTQSVAIDNKILNLLDTWGIPYVFTDQIDAEELVDIIDKERRS